MSNAPCFRPKRNALLAALMASVFAAEADAAAARVDFAHGAATVAGADGTERPLVRGAQLDSGDTVRTSDGRAQLRFSDGAYVSLQPNTEFSIREYRYDGKTDGSERGFFALTKGAIRTVTGLVGRVNRNRYRITTPTATVGIRGTGGVVQVLNDGSTLIVGTSGIWSLSNPAGSIDVPAGVSAVAPSAPEAPPQQSSQAPQAGPAPVAQESVVAAQGEQRTASGEPVVLPAAPVALPAIAIASNKNASSLAAVASFDAAGRLTEADLGNVTYKLESGGSHAEARSDGVLTWGRWIGPVSINGTMTKYSTDQGMHYVVGLPSAVMPATGTASYVASTAAGTATSPTDVAGGKGVGSFTGRIDVSFGANAALRGSFDVAMPNAKYSWTSSATATGNSFVMSASNQQITAAVTTAGVTGCASSCSAKLYGFFAGSGAERIGAGYNIVDSGTGANIVGAAAFQRQ